MPYDGMSQQQFAQTPDRRLQGGRRADRARSGRSRSTCSDILYWIEREPDFGRQAVYSRRCRKR